MPMIINAHGKAIKTHSLDKIIREATMQHLRQLYEELEKIQIDTATGDALDRIAELYGWTRKNDLLVPTPKEAAPAKAHDRFRITSGGKTHIQHSIGFTMTEEISVGIINPRAITKLTKVSNE